MESASFLKPSIPWGPKTQLHSQAVYGQASNWLSAPTSQWPHPTLRKQESKGLEKFLAGSAQDVGGNTTWLNPVDTRCSCMPVQASRVSLLFSWACVLCRETSDSTEPSGPPTGDKDLLRGWELGCPEHTSLSAHREQERCRRPHVPQEEPRLHL